MNIHKFAQMEREFPFLTSILEEQGLSAEAIGYINVCRADRNLLEVTPCAWAHDLGQWGDDEGYRHFWVVSSGKSDALKSSWNRAVVPHGEKANETATPIGSQLALLNRHVEYIVEIHYSRDDFSDPSPCIAIYKMEGFNWQRWIRPAQTT